MQDKLTESDARKCNVVLSCDYIIRVKPSYVAFLILMKKLWKI